MAVPHLAPYCVSKFALVGLSDALRAELSSKNISVTTVAPGLLRTGSHKNAFFKGQHRKEFAWFSLGASNPLVSMDADRAACQILDAVRNRRPELTITFAARLAAIVQALLPNLMADLMKLAARLLPRMPIQIKPLQLQGHSDPIADVREVASMEGRDRVESLGGLEVAAAQEKD